MTSIAAEHAPSLPSRAIRLAPLSAVLFLLAAWPLLLVESPPFQDLPNHVATAAVIGDLAAYPEYVFNGFFKTNAALFAWLVVGGKLLGTRLAARVFTAVVLAANAVVLPRFVRHFTGSDAKTWVACLVLWPMVHPWFASMGMLDFALGVPLSLALLVLLDGHAQAPSWPRGLAIAAVGAVTWYAHVFPLLIVHGLIGLEALRRPTWRERVATGVRYFTPLLPVLALALGSVLGHLNGTAGNTGGLRFDKTLAAWELVYNLWAEWFWGFTNRSVTSIVPCIVLGVLGVRELWRRRSDADVPTFFSPSTMLVLALLYVFVPYKITNWFHVNSRLLPFLWCGLLLYLPARIPRWLGGILVASAVLYSAGMGVDYVRLDEDRKEFTAGMDAVPEGARLLPLVFDVKGSSVNTRNLQHMWGWYVHDRHTSAPLLFAHSRSFPLTYREPPPLRFSHLLLENVASETATPASLCAAESRFDGCNDAFREAWTSFYADALPRFDHVLLWSPTPEALALIPPAYVKTFERGKLLIYARQR